MKILWSGSGRKDQPGICQGFDRLRYGTLPQYVIPHPEGFTIPKYIKGVKRIEVRGTWPEKNMRRVRALYDYGFLRNDKVKINGVEIGSRDFIAAYLDQSPEGRKQDLWGYALHVEVVGMRKGEDVRHVLTTTHPSKEVKGWEDPPGYTKCVGIPLSIGAQMIAKGKVKAKGIVAVIPQLRSQVHFRSRGGLFTRSVSAAHPFLVEQLSAIRNPKNHL